MAYYVGHDVVVTIEEPDGTVYHGKVMATQLTQHYEPIDVTMKGDLESSSIDGLHTWEIQLQGIGDLWFAPRDTFTNHLKVKRSAIEWRCEFCGSVQPKAATKCAQCAAPRSFLYEA